MLIIVYYPGCIMATGTAGEPITFTAPSNVVGASWYFKQDSGSTIVNGEWQSGSLFSHVYLDNWTVYVESTVLALRSVTFTANTVGTAIEAAEQGGAALAIACRCTC